jgi:hypothetical protein
MSAYNARAEADRALLATCLRTALTGAGFLRATGREDGTGEVWSRRVEKRPGYGVVIRTSIDPDTGAVYGSGEARIEVCGVHKADGAPEASFGAAQPVLRTGTVDTIVERTLERARAVYRGVLDGVPHVHVPDVRDEPGTPRPAPLVPDNACTRCGGEGYRNDNPHWINVPEAGGKVCFRCRGDGREPARSTLRR